MTLDDAGLDLLFREARSHNKFTDQPVTDDELRALYDILKMGPTSANCSPARFLFLRTKEAKQKLAPALSSGNLEKTMAAPVTAIVAYDPKFHDHLPKLFPHNQEARSWFTSNEFAGCDHRIPQRHAAGRLSASGRARRRARHRSDVGLRQCLGGRAVPGGPRLAIEFPVQSWPWRSGGAVPTLPAARVLPSVRIPVGQKTDSPQRHRDAEKNRMALRAKRISCSSCLCASAVNLLPFCPNAGSGTGCRFGAVHGRRCR